jgi:hypothetical protein
MAALFHALSFDAIVVIVLKLSTNTNSYIVNVCMTGWPGVDSRQVRNISVVLASSQPPTGDVPSETPTHAVPCSN